MAVPTITSVTPNSGPTAGRLLVAIAGTNFQLSPTPPPGPTNGILAPTVRVLFGTELAVNVAVVSSTKLYCYIPSGDDGPVDVTVTHLDPLGVPIVGETVTAVAAFTYTRVLLTAQSDLTRLVRTLLRQIKREVIKNVSLTVSTDYDSQTIDMLNLIDTAEKPAIVLFGPELRQNRFYSLNQTQITPDTGTLFEERKVPFTVDLNFSLWGISDRTIQTINLVALTDLFFHRNKFISMLRVDGDPSKGTVRYEMDWQNIENNIRIGTQPNESDIRVFNGEFLIRGFDLEDLAGVDDDSVIARGAQVDEDGLTFSVEQKVG